MYHRYFDYLKADHHPLSIVSIISHLCVPETYELPTLADFARHRDEFKMTGTRLFPP